MWLVGAGEAGDAAAGAWADEGPGSAGSKASVRWYRGARMLRHHQLLPQLLLLLELLPHCKRLSQHQQGAPAQRTWPTNSLRGAMALSLVWLPAAARRGLAKWHTSGRPLPFSSGVVPFTLSMARSASAHRLNWTCATVAGGSVHSMQDVSNRRIKPNATVRPARRRKSIN